MLGIKLASPIPKPKPKQLKKLGVFWVNVLLLKELNPLQLKIELSHSLNDEFSMVLDKFYVLKFRKLLCGFKCSKLCYKCLHS